jgi:hypothetical protein
MNREVYSNKAVSYELSKAAGGAGDARSKRKQWIENAREETRSASAYFLVIGWKVLYPPRFPLNYSN